MPFRETWRDFESASRTLKKRSEPFPGYGWSAFSVSAVGRFDQHLRWLFDYPTELDGVRGRDEGGASAFFDALKDSVSAGRIFFPKLDGGRLRLREGSVLFDGPYGDLSDEVVYLAVSAAVQNAREGRRGRRSTAGRERFDENPFVGAVIDPQTFSRFSDGVLQGALLRCLHPSELDYSRSSTMSRQMRQIFVAVLKNRTNVVGEAAVEFIAALAAKKIEFKGEDKSVVFKAVEQTDMLRRVWKAFTKEPVF